MTNYENMLAAIDAFKQAEDQIDQMPLIERLKFCLRISENRQPEEQAAAIRMRAEKEVKAELKKILAK